MFPPPPPGCCWAAWKALIGRGAVAGCCVSAAITFLSFSSFTFFRSSLDIAGLAGTSSSEAALGCVMEAEASLRLRAWAAAEDAASAAASSSALRASRREISIVMATGRPCAKRQTRQGELGECEILCNGAPCRGQDSRVAWLRRCVGVAQREGDDAPRAAPRLSGEQSSFDDDADGHTDSQQQQSDACSRNCAPLC